MAEILGALKRRFLLSLNDTPEVRAIFAGFEIEDGSTTYTLGNADRGRGIAEPVISVGHRPGDGVVASQARLL